MSGAIIFNQSTAQTSKDIQLLITRLRKQAFAFEKMAPLQF